MDTLTHALSGALIGRATAARQPGPNDLSVRARVAAGFAAAAFPDADFVLGFVSPVTYLLYHRGVTHSVLMLPLWALLLAWLLSLIARDRRGFRPWYGVCALGIGAHIVGDLITSFGTLVFAPFSDWRAAIGTTFIIDLWFTGIIAAGLVASLLWRHTRVPALAAGVALAGYVGMQWMLKQQALEFGERYALAQGLSAARVEAYPRPVSPFNWTVYVSDAQSHRFAHVNLLRKAPRDGRSDAGFIAQMDAAYLPLDAARWETRSRFGDDPAVQALARAAWEAPQLAFFRWFAGMPALDGVTQDSDCVWFVDLRFVNPGRDWVPFRFGGCRDANSTEWRAYQRDRALGRLPLD